MYVRMVLVRVSALVEEDSAVTIYTSVRVSRQAVGEDAELVL